MELDLRRSVQPRVIANATKQSTLTLLAHALRAHGLLRCNRHDGGAICGSRLPLCAVAFTQGRPLKRRSGRNDHAVQFSDFA